jgi:hypothetical protein
VADQVSDALLKVVFKMESFLWQNLSVLQYHYITICFFAYSVTTNCYIIIFNELSWIGLK